MRMALGARWSDVQRLVLGEAARLVVVGLALGVGVALAMSRVLNGMLFGIKSTDPATYLSVASVLALAACEVPALRATRVDPVRALRAE